MNEEDWDAIIKIIKHLEEGMHSVKQGYYPIVSIKEALVVAENRKQQILSKGQR